MLISTYLSIILLLSIISVSSYEIGKRGFKPVLKNFIYDLFN